MYTKTATAVVLALLGAANATDNNISPQPTKEDYAKTAMVKHHSCTGRNVIGSPAADTEWDCFEAAKAVSADSAHQAKNLCVSFTPASKDMYDNDVPASCSVVQGYGLSCQQTKVTDTRPYFAGTSSVYMKAGQFQNNDVVQEADCPKGRVERWCRCAGWTYGRLEHQDGNPVLEQNSEGTGNRKSVNSSNDNDEDYWNYSVIKCPQYKNAEGVFNAENPAPFVETNFVQLEKDSDGNLQYFTECPAEWEIPADAPPKDQGSFKGYTNKYTFSRVNDDKHEKGNVIKFNNESEGYGEWPDAAKVGLIGGFAVFGIAIVLVVSMIAVDMRRRMAMYEDLIAGDLQKLQQMGLSSKMREFEAELEQRFAGVKDDAGVDDQLVTQALELKPQDFAHHM